MSLQLIIREAKPEDFLPVCTLLQSENLPVSDLRKDLADFFLAETEAEPVASIGLDRYGPDALLRSMVVKGSHRNLGIAADLVKHLEAHARQQGISTLYLITNTAEDYFGRKGFVSINRDQVPPLVATSAEFNGLCPASSAIMRKDL